MSRFTEKGILMILALLVESAAEPGRGLNPPAGAFLDQKKTHQTAYVTH
jgi:hypothetical protein